jgi:hypothetical protein
VLSINIKAIDPKLVAILVLQMREILLNQQLDCILMVLRLMIMGISGCLSRELNVVGFTLDEIRVKIESNC